MSAQDADAPRRIVCGFLKRSARGLWRVIVGILKEISDESAYERHLRAHGREHSGEEWRRFSDERGRRKFQRAKCC
jgi:hypothetical protein